MVFQTDQILNAKDCGSVVLDLRGQIAGVNIARAGRTDSYAIPARVIADLLKSVDFDTLKAAQPGDGGTR